MEQYLEEQIYGLASELEEYLHAQSAEDARLVQKGLMLYRQGMVTNLHIEDGGITATVQDVTPVKVHLNPIIFSLSACSCPQEDLCRHQMAVFFSAYAQVGSVADWVSEWREPMKEKAAISKWGMQTAKDLVKANGVLAPDYDRWVHSFETSFDLLLASQKFTSPYVVPELFEIYVRRIHASAPVEQEWRLLYELVAAVISFRKLAVLSEQLGHTREMVRRTYLHLFENILDDVEDLADKISVQTMPFAFDEFIEKLRDDGFRALTCVSGFELERIYLHRMLWTLLFKQKSWREEEVSRLVQALKEIAEDESPLALESERIHLLFLLEDDEQALKLIGFIEDGFIAPHLLWWTQYLSSLKTWPRVLPVIELLMQKAKGFLAELDGYRSCSGFTRDLLRAIAPYCTEMNRPDLFERAMVQTLPYSYPDYEYSLFERGQYDKWAELLAFVGFNYYDLPKERVKVMEKEQPELLLGMLHQTAQREIDGKNRSSYRLAVRHLKKLRTLYKKLKRVDDWEYFMDTLMERTKRLRAFHEECQRGKLI